MTHSLRAKAAAVLIAAGGLTVGLVGTAQAGTNSVVDPHCKVYATPGCVFLTTPAGAMSSWYVYGAHNVTVGSVATLMNYQSDNAVVYACEGRDGNGPCSAAIYPQDGMKLYPKYHSIYMSAHPTS